MHPMQGFSDLGESYTKDKPNRPRNSSAMAEPLCITSGNVLDLWGYLRCGCTMREADETAFRRDIQSAGSSFHGLSLHRMVRSVQPVCGVQSFNGRGSANSGQFGHR